MWVTAILLQAQGGHELKNRDAAAGFPEFCSSCYSQRRDTKTIAKRIIAESNDKHSILNNSDTPTHNNDHIIIPKLVRVLVMATLSRSASYSDT